MKQIIASALICILMLWTISGSIAGVYTENFTNYSGYDPYNSTGYWNTGSNQLEIHPIEILGSSHSLDVCPDGSGGWYYYSNGAIPGFVSQSYLQHFDSNGFASWPHPGKRVDSNGSSWKGAATALTDGDVLVVWMEADNNHILLAQRYDVSGQTVWPHVVRINHTDPAFRVYSFAAEQLPENQVAIAFTDNRSGSIKVYLQKITSIGNLFWADDRQLQQASLGNESNIDMDSDTDGNLFVSWTQGSPDSNVAFTAIDTNGAIAWDPAIIASLDSTNNQNQNSIAVLDGEAVIVSWIESDAAEYRLETQRWEYSGVCLSATDRLQFHSLDPMYIGEADTMSNGNVLLCSLMSYYDLYYLISQVIKPDMIPFDGIYQVHAFDDFRQTTNFVVQTTSSEEAVIIWDVDNVELYGKTRMQKLGVRGQSLWPDCIELRGSESSPFRSSNHFTKNSGDNGGFKYTWNSNRSTDLYGFGCKYMSPTQPDHIPVQFDPYNNLLKISSVQASDGTIFTAFTRRTQTMHTLELMCYSSAWEPLWTNSVILKENNPDTYFTNFDICINDQGKVSIVWTEISAAARGLYYQLVNRDQSTAFPSPVRIDFDHAGANIYNLSIQPGTSGSAVIAWYGTEGGFLHIWVQKIASDGSIWPDSMDLINVSPDGINGISLEKVDDLYYVVFSFLDAGISGVNSVSFNRNGQIVDPITKISTGNYDYCFKLATENMDGKIYVVWAGRVDGYEMVYGQKLDGGSAVWVDKTLTDAQYLYTQNIDIIKTGNDSLAFAFKGVNQETSILVQEMDTNGALTYPSEKLMIEPDPIVYSFEYGISSQLNSGEDISWATITGTDDPRGGSVQYWLSNDGGINWYQAIQGLPIVFPVPGHDLRCSADLYSEPYQQVSPLVTSITTSWNEGDIATDIVLNQEFYQAGDNFYLSIRHTNSGDPVTVNRFVILDVYSYFWFWPSWSEESDFSRDIIQSGYSEDVILSFDWPEVTGTAADLRFWAALLDPDSGELVGPWDFVIFGYGE